MPRPLDSCGQLPLMPCTVPGNTPRNNFTTLSNQISQPSNILVIDQRNLIGTESTDFLSQEAFPSP
jgi:hypothetical protein